MAACGQLKSASEKLRASQRPTVTPLPANVGGAVS
jgi:hypothetical protein